MTTTIAEVKEAAQNIVNVCNLDVCPELDFIRGYVLRQVDVILAGVDAEAIKISQRRQVG